MKAKPRFLESFQQTWRFQVLFTKLIYDFTSLAISVSGFVRKIKMCLLFSLKNMWKT